MYPVSYSRISLSTDSPTRLSTQSVSASMGPTPQASGPRHSHRGPQSVRAPRRRALRTTHQPRLCRNTDTLHSRYDSLRYCTACTSMVTTPRSRTFGTATGAFQCTGQPSEVSSENFSVYLPGF